MKFNLKTTGFRIDEPLRVYVESKIVSPVERLLRGQAETEAVSFDIEIERETKHHKKGRIWRAEANLTIPKGFFRAEAEAEDIRSAIDMVEAEILSELKKYKEKLLAKSKRVARKTKNELKLDPAARLKQFRP